MKKLIPLIASLALVLFFAGCATTSDAGNSEPVEPQMQTWNDASSQPKATPEAPAPYITEAPETPKQAKKKSLDALFDGTTNWPDNTASVPAVMSPAKDDELWDSFCIMVQEGTASIGEMESYLLDWYDQYGWTPEFYAACHNFYFAKASDLLDHISADEDFNAVYKNLDRSFDSCFYGAKQYPERLDIWCGYVHAAIMLGDYESAESCIQAIFDRLDFNNNNWYWSYNEPFYETEAEKENEFVQIMHDYITEFMNADSLDYAYSVSLRLLDCFPDNVIALNDVAISYLYAGELESALPYLERAMELDPSDLIVMTNLAYVYEDLGEYEASRELADKMIKSGDEETVSRGIVLSAELNQLMNPDK